MKGIILFTSVSLLLACSKIPNNTRSQDNYTAMKEEMLSGWNTWDTRSVMRQVKLPERYALSVHVNDLTSGKTTSIAFIGNKVSGTEKIVPGLHTWNGSYTEQEFVWHDIRFKLETAHADEDLVILFTPIKGSRTDFSIDIKPSFLWDAEGEIIWYEDRLEFHAAASDEKVYGTSEGLSFDLEDSTIQVAIDDVCAVASGKQRSIEEVIDIVSQQRKAALSQFADMGESGEAWKAVQTILAWNTIYDPTHNRLITPVSRIWNYGWKGYVLFCWDNYFASYMCSFDSKELAYTNAIEMTHEITDGGFIPNYAATNNLKSRDRSQPPVGSMMIEEIYKRYPEDWFLEEVFDELLSWNRWWANNRDLDGYLCWGSSPYKSVTGDRREVDQNNMKAARFESGLDNSPMYDEIAYDTSKHIMLLADVGLMGMYIGDCESLAAIAKVLGKPEATELRERADYYRKNLQSLWHEEFGLFLNKNLSTGEVSYRISPTNFYALIGKAASQEQAERMVNEHLLNQEEFWGDWVLPSIARNDPAYPDNSYWRGRIWAPMNFLVYLGMRNYLLPEASKQLAEKSMALMMKDWNARGYIHENYNADTGEGVDVRNSDNFYHWGGLLGFIYMIENGLMAPVEDPIKE